MQITFLVGNGFDISLGIKASYRDFYEWYLQQDTDKEHVKEFKKDIKNDIEGEGENWSDFEMGLGKYTINFSIETAEKFIECYEDARESIIQYLNFEKKKGTVEVLNENVKNDLKNGLINYYQELSTREKQIFDSFSKEQLNEDVQINFLSFNYTDTLDICLKQISTSPLKSWNSRNGNKTIKVNPKIIHVHGTTEEFPIIGVNDISQFANEELIKVDDVYQIMIKSQSISAIGEVWHDDAEKMMDASRVICVWGMSLGASDAKWWVKIARWLKASSNRHLIIYWHEKTPINKRSVLQYNRVINGVKNKFLSFSGFKEQEINGIKDRIHVVTNTEKVLRVQPSGLLEYLHELEKI